MTETIAEDIYLGGNIKLSKNAMTELFSNLSLHALSKSDDTISLDFTQIENLTSNINNLLRIKREKEEFQEIIDDKKFIPKNHFMNY